MPRLSDKFLGECGSRRFVQRAELDASSDDSGDKDYKHWGETVFAALQKGLPAVRLMPLLSRFARSCFASALFGRDTLERRSRSRRTRPGVWAARPTPRSCTG